MPKTDFRAPHWILLIFLGIHLLGNVTSAQDSVKFNREILPILSAKCFACHGPDASSREADLRLDRLDSALELEAIVPGNPNQSELISRIYSEDEDLVMPPHHTGSKLSKDQKELLKRWIKQGAKYETHWAFSSPDPVQPQPAKDPNWGRGAIDAFVLKRLKQAKLKPSARAENIVLVRRLFLDLVGLPPTPDEADRWLKKLNDGNSDELNEAAYLELVNHLLDSKQYGERWARPWLDLARYSDTNGYEKDRPRSIWLYRDWVINSINDDMPYDQFSIEQLAGDMFPNPTQDQLVATGFHRNTMLNEEGGIDPLEYRYYAVVDRVATTGIVWLGLTTGCAQCHSHKYDPISHTDYFKLMGLLNNADEPDLILTDEKIEQTRKAIESQLSKLKSELKSKFPPAKGAKNSAKPNENFDREFGKWLAEKTKTTATWTIAKPTALSSNLPKLELADDGSIFASGDFTKRDTYELNFDLKKIDFGPNSDPKSTISAIRLEVLPDPRLPASGPGRAYYEGRKGDFFLSELTASVGQSKIKFSDASTSFGKISIGSGSADGKNVYDNNGSTGWSTAGKEGKRHQLVLNLETPVEITQELKLVMLFERHFVASLGKFRISFALGNQTKPVATSMPLEIEKWLSSDMKKNPDAKKTLEEYFLLQTPLLKTEQQQIKALESRMPRPPITMVMQERPADNPRSTFRHHRGEYLSPKEEVEPGLPQMFVSDNQKGPTNRLELAKWLVSSKNPLAARVAVNRAWREFFGTGIVKTSGDFGTQSDVPSHPKLLDWLAHEFVKKGWSMKKLHRTIVTSETYRQSSKVSQQSKQATKIDPQNRLLWRGARTRIPAESIRDSLLKSSGLLSAKMFGPGVYPPQPASVTALAYGGYKWKPSQGEDRYRRSIYTFSKRTTPFAAFNVFDSPSGENCSARRNRSNTPLQALTLLNDEMFMEMSRFVATQVDLSQTPTQITTEIFRRFLTRKPTDEEIADLLDFYQSNLKNLGKDRASVQKLLNLKTIDSAKATHWKQQTQRAAWLLVTRVLMNLDETITKQ